MIIGALSDTHLFSPDPFLDHILDDLLGNCQMILHAGDIVRWSVLERLLERDVIAVAGNMDDREVAGTLPQVRMVSAAGKRIGLIHGWGSKQGLERRIVNRFEEKGPDIIVYGHSHVPFWGLVEGVMMFNPGSANPWGHRGTGSVGIIEITENGMDAQFLSVERRKPHA